MSYTRRSFLRNTALISMGSTMSTLPFLRGCKWNQFPSGIRIFFSGAWLFSDDPDTSGNMRAITVDPGGLLTHFFPYGVWDGARQAGTWDDETGRSYLGSTYTTPTAPVTPHKISVAGPWTAPFANTGQLFRDANTKSRFSHIPNSSEYTFSINCNTPGVRVISLPIPTRIIPAAIRQGVDITDPKNRIPKSTCKTSDAGGVATTHIFDYQNATSMTFAPLGGGTGPAPTVTGQTEIAGDYHFHAVPQCFYDKHDRDMFKALFGLIQGGAPSGSQGGPWKLDLCLAPSGATGAVTLGELLPPAVTPSELETLDSLSDIKKMDFMKKSAKETASGSLQNLDVKPLYLVLASCCSGGGGVGN